MSKHKDHKELVGRIKKVVKKTRRKLSEDQFDKELQRTINFLSELKDHVSHLQAKAAVAKEAKATKAPKAEASKVVKADKPKVEVAAPAKPKESPAPVAVKEPVKVAARAPAKAVKGNGKAANVATAPSATVNAPVAKAKAPVAKAKAPTVKK